MASPLGTGDKSQPRVAVAKYKCTCGFKWQMKNTRGEEMACRVCHKPVLPYKTEPKPLRPQTQKVVLRRMFGEFYCTQCKWNWFSAYAWKGKWQKCHRCGEKCKPISLTPLLPPRYNPDEPHVQKPHRQDLCEVCKELGGNCKDVSEVMSEEVTWQMNDDDHDDESVYSEYSTTSDSSAASAPALQDVDGDVTPVASDEETADELLETGLAKLKI